jgi:hypothetical protein
VRCLQRNGLSRGEAARADNSQNLSGEVRGPVPAREELRTPTEAALLAMLLQHLASPAIEEMQPRARWTGNALIAILRHVVIPNLGHSRWIASGFSPRRNVYNRLGEVVVGVPRAFRVACHSGFLSVDVQ